MRVKDFPLMQLPPPSCVMFMQGAGGSQVRKQHEDELVCIIELVVCVFQGAKGPRGPPGPPAQVCCSCNNYLFDLNYTILVSVAFNFCEFCFVLEL